MSITHLPAQATQSLACLRGEHQHCTGTVGPYVGGEADCACAHHAQDTEARFIRLAVGIGDLGATADLVEQRIREAEALLASLRQVSA